MKRPSFETMKISPDGRYLAATVPAGDDKTLIAIIDRQTMQPSAVGQLRGNEHVHEFYWVGEKRVVFSVARRFGVHDQPMLTGELYGIDVDGRNANVLFGYRNTGGGAGTRIRGGEAEMAWASIFDLLHHDDHHVLIAVQSATSSEEARTEARLLNVQTGRTRTLARSPIPRADFLADLSGAVRLAYGERIDQRMEIHVRNANNESWNLLVDEAKVGRMVPLVFHPDGKQVYVSAERPGKPKAIVLLDTVSGSTTEVVADAVSDPERLLFGAKHGHLYAVTATPGKPRLLIVDADAREARLAKALLDAFPGQFAYFTSFTRDGKRGLVHVYSDRNPGEFYLFDLERMAAEFIATNRAWIDPEAMSEMRPVQLTARDGMDLHGYLTVPRGVSENSLPLIVNPHGGPHGVRDRWGFQPDVQLFANRGFAVLQLNFRGSGGYGADFIRAGYRQWGKAMQTDLADAVAWLIGKGLVDKDRICIYGASYGGYAAMMNTALHPDMYRCAVGYVGVYDLTLMYNEGDIRKSMWGRSYLDMVLGRESLGASSPLRLAEQIKVPVMLVHGSQDQRVPQTHADRMRSALTAAGNPPEWLVKRTEGHGFYSQDNVVELHQKLLAFFERNLVAKPRAPAD